MLNKITGFFIATFALAFYPDPASAGPVVAVIGAIAGALSAAAAAIGTWTVTAFGVSAAAGAAFGAFVVKLAVGLALYALATALMPRPRIPDPSDRMVNFAQPVSYFETAYGRVRKGGPIGFTGFRSDKRHYTVILAAHRIKGVVQHWLDEWEVDTNSSGLVTTSPIYRSFSRSYGSIRLYRGTTTQAADSQLVGAFSQWTSAHDMTGLAYGAIWAQRPPSDRFVDVYPRSRQWVYAPVIEGRDEIYDPRTDTFVYSNNAALVIADWIVNLLKEDVDWDEVAFEADVCDTLVDLKGGGTVKKWTLNGVINDQEDFENVRSQLGTACDCFFYEREDGKIGFNVGRYAEPTVTLTEDDFYAITVVEGNAGSNNSNEIVIRYSEPSNGYRETPSGIWVNDPLGPDTRQEYAVFWVDNHNQAIRVAKRLSRSVYARYKVTGTLKTTAQNIVGKRFVSINNAEIGVSGIFEVNKLVKNEDMLTYEIEAHSVEPEDFSYNAEVEEPIQPAYDKTGVQLTDYTPLSLSGTAVNFTGVPGIELTWTHAYEFLGTDVQYRTVGDPDWIIIENFPSSTLQTIVTPLEDGETYEFQIRSTSGQGGTPYSEWYPIVPITVQAVAISTPPPALQSLAVAVDTTSISVNFLPPNSPLYSATRLYRANYASGYTGPFDFLDSSLIQTEYGAPNTADTHLDESLALGVYAYWGIPINASGVAGPTSGPETAEIV